MKCFLYKGSELVYGAYEVSRHVLLLPDLLIHQVFNCDHNMQLGFDGTLHRWILEACMCRDSLHGVGMRFDHRMDVYRLQPIVRQVP